MTDWQDQLRSHPIHASLAEARDGVRGFDRTQLPDDQQSDVVRLLAVFAHVEGLLASADPLLTSRSTLQSGLKALNNLRNEWNNFVSNRDAGHLQNALIHAEALLDHSTRWTLPTASGNNQPLHLVLEEFRRLADARIADLRRSSDSLSSTQAEVMKQASDMSGQLSSLQAQIETQKGRLDAAIADFQKQFSDSEDRRRTINEGTAADFAKAGAQTIEKQEQEFAALRDRVTSETTALLERLSAKEAEAKRIVQITANVGVTGNYHKEAEIEQGAANLFRWIALGMMILIVAGVGSTIWIAVGKDATLQQIAIRLAITLALAIPAGYAAREAEHHRRNERRYRRMELELSSIDAYLAPLPEADKQQLKARLTERYFGLAETEKLLSGDSATASSALDIVKVAIENLTKR